MLRCPIIWHIVHFLHRDSIASASLEMDGQPGQSCDYRVPIIAPGIDDVPFGLTVVVPMQLSGVR